MGKKIALILIIAGLVIIGKAGFDIYQVNAEQDKALEVAKELVFEDVEGEFEDLLLDFDPGQGEIIGILSIPRLDSELPIVEGTHEDELARGVGHFQETGFPTEDKQILLSGHRDTVFRNLGELEIGDHFEVKMSYGTFIYEIQETFIVDADDRTVIDYTIDEEVLTVSTCYPFSYVGNAPDRYIINATPVKEVSINDDES